MPSRPVRTTALRVSALLLCLACAPACPPAHTQSSSSALSGMRAGRSGEFVDRAGKKHRWTIDSSHTLLWEQESYQPIGGTFAPRTLAEGATEENWKRDTDALDLLKAKGIQDILIDPVRSAVEIPAPIWQRLLDYLDQNGFRYGIGFGRGLATPVSGTVVKPLNYRIEVEAGQSLTWNVSQTDSGYYLLTDGQTILKDGEARVRNNSVNMPGYDRLSQKSVALLYPHKTLPFSSEGTLPDLWMGYDTYRDQLLTLFTQVKFGQGLRFFLDPLAHPFGLGGEADGLIPDSPAFRLEWEAFLTAKYRTLETLMTEWDLVKQDAKDFKQIARLIPLTDGRRGYPAFYDPILRKTLEMSGDIGRSRFWADFYEWRSGAIQTYTSGIAEFLHREIADVPVVFTYSPYGVYPLANGKPAAYDGIGIATYARGSGLVTSGADAAYGQVQASPTPLWCLVTETLDSVNTERAQGYLSRENLFLDFDWLRKFGVKGIFVRGFQVLATTNAPAFTLLDKPQQLDWLKEYAEQTRRTTRFNGSPLQTLPYPANAGGLVTSGPIGNGGVWWVPSRAPGAKMEFGLSYAGYKISLPEGETTVLWSLRGPRETHLKVADPRAVQAFTPDGSPVPIKRSLKSREISLMMDTVPTVFRGVGEEMFPVEAAEDTLRQIQALYAQGKAMKLPVGQLDATIVRTTQAIKRDNNPLALSTGLTALNELISIVQPYFWLEAERADVQTFSEVRDDEAASGRKYLSLNTDARPGRDGYSAQYNFFVNESDTYTLWVAATPPGPNTSPFAWVLDTAQAQDSRSAVVTGAPYMSERFVWMNLGRIALTRGAHKITLTAERAPENHRYQLALDAILVTRSSFTPNGTMRPFLSDVVPAAGKPAARGKK